MKGVSCLSLGLTFLRPRPLGLFSLHPSHPPAPAQKCHRGRASRWICWGGERSLVEQREASRARLRWFGGGEEQGDRRLASACLGPGSRRASVGKKKKREREREREAGKESEQSGTRRNWLSSEGYWVARPAKPRGGIFKCFPPLSLYLFTPDVNVAGVNMSSVQLAEKSDSHLGPGLATTPFPVLCK